MKSRLARLEIDFRRPGRSSPWAGRVLMAVAAAVVLDTALSFYEAQVVIQRNRAALAKVPASTRPASKEETVVARETVERLATPWPNLFGALEGAASDQVALLGVEPDPKAGKVLISGESKDFLAALTYVLNLSRSAALSHVQLVRHETKADDPQHPVAFAVSATWKEGVQ
jgi:hypothetical protein